MPPAAPQKRSRAGALTAGAVAVAIVSAGIGGGVALLVQPDRPAASSSVTGLAPSVPAASLPAGIGRAGRGQGGAQRGQAGGRPRAGSPKRVPGIILSSDGLILTNNHVVAAAKDGPGGPGGAQTKVTFADGRTTAFTVVGTDPSSDIAVVRAQGASGLTPITLGSSANLRVGQDVVAIGSPLGLEGTVTTGIISALNRPVAAGGDAQNQNTVLDAIQTDAAINPGNSGGALVNMNGELVGVNSAIATLGGDAGPAAQSGSIGLGFAIPVDQAKRIADELIQNGTASHASLGVQVGNDAAVDGAQDRRGHQRRRGGGRGTAQRRRGDQGRRPGDRQRRRAGRRGAIQGAGRQGDADVPRPVGQAADRGGHPRQGSSSERHVRRATLRVAAPLSAAQIYGCTHGTARGVGGPGARRRRRRPHRSRRGGPQRSVGHRTAR